MSSVSFDGYEDIRDASVSLTNGVDPDMHSLGIAWSSGSETETRKSLPYSGSLIMSDGENTITIPDCRGNDFTADTMASGGSPLRVNVMDWRWKWRYAQTITGEYNRVDSGGNKVGEKKSLFQLFGVLVSLLDVPGVWQNDAGEDLGEDGLPGPDIYPYVNWVASSPSYELQSLCANYGYVISPTLVDGVLANCRIQLDSTGAIPTDKEIKDTAKTYKLSRSGKIVPEFSQFVGGRNIYQVELDLVSVCPAWIFQRDTDETTNWYPTSDDSGIIAYRPPDGWYAGCEDYEVTGVLSNPDWVETYKKLSTDYVFKTYRLPDTFNIGDTVYNREDVVSLWSDILCEDFQLVNGERKFAKGYVKGEFKTDTYFQDKDANQSTSDTEALPDYVIDKTEGVIRFRERVFDIDDDEKMIGATLRLVCCFEAEVYTKTESTKAVIEDIYKIDYEPVEGIYGHLRRDDLYIRNLCRYALSGVDLTKLEYAGNSTIDKIPTDIEASSRIKEELVPSYASSFSDGKDLLFVGIRHYSPNGNIEEVTFNINENGPTTAVGVGKQLSPYIDPRKLRESQIIQAHNQQAVEDRVWNKTTEPYVTRDHK